MITFLIVSSFILLLFALLGFYFFKSSKEMPKTWFEWQEEIKLQILGMNGLYQDFILRNKNKVELYKQPEKVVVITGGNRGIGLRIVEKLLQCDMTVVIGVRDPVKAEQNITSKSDLSQSKGKLICEQVNLDDLTSVRLFAKSIKKKFNKIDILINNAAIMCAPYQLTKDGFESHFAVNHLSHFLLTHLLLPELKKGGTPGKNARIINVSSIVHLMGEINYKDINGSKRYYPATAYNQSKLAQVLFTKHLEKVLRHEKANIQVTAVHPGVVNTGLFNYSSTTAVPGIKRIIFKSPEEGSRTVVYAAISPNLEGQSGIYLTNCVRARAHSVAKNEEACEKLFNFSCVLLEIENFGSEAI